MSAATYKRTKLQTYIRDQAIDSLNAQGFPDTWISESLIQTTIKDLDRERKQQLAAQAQQQKSLQFQQQ
jgi:hypothetical protein